jgi:hypothetical protein
MPEFESPGIETSDLSTRGILWFAVSLVLTLVAVFFAARVFQSALAHNNQRDASRITRPATAVPPPHLQSEPTRDLAAFRAAQSAKLHGYGWVDRKAGVIHIPIERAMELTARRGLPVRKSTSGGPP